MNSSYIKLNAKKHLVKCHFKCFLVSCLPYVTIVLFGILNYYLYILLKNTSFDIWGLKSSYAVYLRATLLTISICLSYFLWRMTSFLTNHYFYQKSRNKNTTYFESVRNFKLRKFICFLTAEMLKIFISIAWASLYYMPCIAVFGTLYFYFNSADFTFNIGLTLLISIFILFIIGSFFFYVTLKRYSMCNAIIFDSKEKDSLKIIAKSIEIMEGKSLKQSMFNISFLGWILSCVLIIPIIYVLPYKMMAKYSCYNWITKSLAVKQSTEKPIIFYIPKKIQN